MIKNRFHGFGSWIKTRWMEILTGALIMLIAVIAFGIGYIHCLARFRDDVLYYESMISAPEPSVCVLCRNGAGTKVHAPCIVNLATGEVAELAIYDPHPTEIGEVTETPKKGHVSYFTGAGALIEQNPDNGYCSATVPQDEDPISPEYFCFDCRHIISVLDRDGYIIADLYDPESVSVFKINNDSDYVIRDYLVIITQLESGSLIIKVQESVCQ